MMNFMGTMISMDDFYRIFANELTDEYEDFFFTDDEIALMAEEELDIEDILDMDIEDIEEYFEVKTLC